MAPPAGYKHRELAHASETTVVRGIRRSLREMIRSGSSMFCDFREGGVAGARAFSAARRGIGIGGLVLGRPAALRYDREELDALLGLCDGVAVSAVSDWEHPELEKVSAHVRSAGKMFALHASEVVREDIDKVLLLKPRFLVHMVKAEEYDLERVAAEGVPIVVCPRANALFGLRPRIDLMRGFGVEVALGSDNAMLQPPEMLPVVQSAWETVRGSGMKPHDILDLAIGGFRKILNLPERMPFTPGMLAEFFVVGNPRMYSAGDPAAELVRHGGTAKVVLASAKGRIWRRRQ